jgi:pyridoxal phosphate enzyme (YggS family)
VTDKSLIHRYEKVLDRIDSAATKAGRSLDEIQLIVVTKGQPIEIVNQAIAMGARTLGENYVEEALPKMAAVDPAMDVEWHMIGHIQSRKARAVCEHFNYVQSVDSLRLAGRLDRFAEEQGKRLPVLLEFNVSGEESKYGWIAWNELEWQSIAQEVAQLLEYKNLEILGLMTMPPYFSNPEQARPYFIRLRKLRDYLATRFSQSSWKELSMGMSADFEVAIEEGATIVRIGTAILGERGRGVEANQ